MATALELCLAARNYAEVARAWAAEAREIASSTEDAARRASCLRYAAGKDAEASVLEAAPVMGALSTIREGGAAFWAAYEAAEP